ncbi:hypothetical protein [Microbacterium aurum]
MLAISASAIGLIPGIGATSYGVAVLVIALLFTAFPVQAALRIRESRDPANRLRPLKAALGFATPVAYLVGALLLIAGAPAGLVVFAAGSILAIMAAAADLAGRPRGGAALTAFRPPRSAEVRRPPAAAA